MKKIAVSLTFFMLVTIVAIPSVESITFSPWYGITMNMEEAQALYENRESTPTITDFTEGQIVGLDIGMLRIAYLMAKPVIFSGGLLDPDEVSTPGYSFEGEPFLAMAMIGFRAPNTGKTGLSLGIFVGYGYSYYKALTQSGSMPEPYEISYVGQDIVGEAVLGLNLGGLELNVGYRHAIIKHIEVSEDIYYDGEGTIPDIKKGTVIENLDGEPYVFDYSGLMVSLGFRFGPSGSALRNQQGVYFLDTGDR